MTKPPAHPDGRDDVAAVQLIEDPSNAVTASGTLSVSDVDTPSGTYTISKVGIAADSQYKLLTGVQSEDDSTLAKLLTMMKLTSTPNQGTGKLVWSFDSGLATALDAIPQDDVLKLEYEITANDGQGGQTTQLVVVAITGTNDAPTVAATQPEAFNKAKQRLKDLRAMLRRAVDVPVTSASVRTESIRDFKKEDFLKAVLKAKEYIMAGDLMQVQVGQRIRKPYVDSPLSLYRALRSLNPSPYMYFYNFGDMQIVGSSPEILVRNESTRDGNRKVTIRPLAGTRPRGATPEQDAKLATELLADPKEIAEHVMLIDLARNDIGRIAEIGSVKVTDKFVIEKYSHVQHIVSNVEGTLKSGMTNLDVLRATFPAGTLSGAPKVRAMELIDELEPVKRGIYGGACGYLSFAGDMDVAIAIRTGIVKDQTLYVQAAAGVVADSVPELEWKETEAKARALLRASELVEEGLE